MASALEVNNIAIAFGGLRAIRDLSLDVPHGSLRGLIGPNGAGKTTLFNLLTGVYAPNTGDIRLDGVSLLGKKPYQIAALGAARTFQNIRLFGELTVLDNVQIASHLHAESGMFAAVTRTAKFCREEERSRERAEELLRLFGLWEDRNNRASNLSYGAQRKLEMARALATKPKVLLLDEPAAGMNPQEKIELSEVLRQVKSQFSCAILLIEHDMGLVMKLCEHIFVLDHGCKIAEGSPVEVQGNAEVIEAYLGVESSDA